jgi:anti-sigma factor RsiW
MTNETTNDGMIERYLDGTMDAAERERFERLLASDERLRRSLKIDEAMTMAIAIDRASAPTRHPEMRARAIDAIARIAPSATALPQTPAPTEKRSKSGHRRGLIYPPLGALLLLGGWLLMRPSENLPSVQTRPAIETRSLPATPDPAPAAAAPSVTAPVEIPSATAPAAESRGSNIQEKESVMPPAVRSTRRSSAVNPPRQTESGRSRSTSTATETARKEHTKPPVFRDPSAQSPVTVDDGKGDGGR